MARPVAEARAGLPIVAVVGRPNVGKSSLVNRVLGRGEAIVEETPGVTRDRRSFVAEWDGRAFEIVDTGGIAASPQGLERHVVEQARAAIDVADVIVLVVDAAVGPLEDDVVVAHELRRTNKPVLVAANKVDDPRDEPAAAAFYRLGLGDPVPLSALHGRASGDFLARLVDLLPAGRAEPDATWAAAAIVGRPNVGKSSLLNALADEARSIVDEAPGTTRDPVDSILRLDDGRTFKIVDTAGMRRQVHIDDPIEYFGWLRSRRTLQRVDLALLVVDAAEGVTGLDQRLAEDVVEAGRACVILYNKWDLVTRNVEQGPDRDRLDRDLLQRLRWLGWAPRVRISAVTKRGIDKIIAAAEAAIASHRRRIGTAALNRVLADAQAARPHPRSHGKAVRILYGAQAETSPPRFVLFGNHRIEPSYLRFVENKIREAEPFEGSPLRLSVRVKRARAASGRAALPVE